MSLDQWSDRNESLNALYAAIQQGTHGLIRNLSLDLTNKDRVVVHGISRSYYGVQLVIATLQQLGDKYSLFRSIQLLLSVNGTLLKLVITHPSIPYEEAGEPASPQDVTRRHQLTLVETV